MKEPFSGRSQRRKLVGEEEEGTEAQREPPHHFREWGSSGLMLPADEPRAEATGFGE